MITLPSSLPSSLPALSTPLYRRLWAYVAWGLLLFMVLRLALLVSYPGDFQSLTLWHIVQSFVVGLRFDLSLLAMLLWLPFLLLTLPLPWTQWVWWQRLWGWVVFAGLVGLAFAGVADTLYFSGVHRHAGGELGILAADADSMLSLAAQQYAGYLLGFALLTLAAAWGWRKLLRPVCVVRGGVLRRTAEALALSIVLIIAARGGAGGKPISVGDAFFSNDLGQGYLALNGAFAVSRGFLDSVAPPAELMPQALAQQRTAQWFAPQGAAAHVEYPLLHSAHPVGMQHKPNVVVLMVESFGANHVDASRKALGLPAWGVTPNFDRLVQEGRLYTRFYANGQRSIQGASALLAGMPIFPGMPLLGEGMEQNRLSFMGDMAQREGYETFFLQSSERFSMRLDVVAQRAGFAHYLGGEDMPELHAQAKPAGNWGTWDHNTFQEANRLFAAAKKPFLGFIFTSSTHTPWLIPDKRWEKFTDGSDESRALNAMYYTDWALGEFIAAAKKSGYFDNTLFIITADHANVFVKDPQHAPNLFHIPLLLVGAGVQPGIDTRVGSQVDVLPTIADAAHWQGHFVALGQSLLQNLPPERRAALSMRDQVLTWISDAGWLSHNLQRRVGQSTPWPEPQAQEAEANMLAIYQTATQAQLKNKLLPP